MLLFYSIADGIALTIVSESGELSSTETALHKGGVSLTIVANKNTCLLCTFPANRHLMAWTLSVCVQVTRDGRYEGAKKSNSKLPSL